MKKFLILVMVAAYVPVTALELDDVRRQCQSAWFGSAEWQDSLSKSASQQVIAKHETIEKCVRETTAHMERDVNLGQISPKDGVPEPPAETDPRLLDKSWENEWEKRWLCENLALYKSGDKGKVVLDGIDEISTHFGLQGLNPRWDWNGEDDRNWNRKDGYRYSIVLQYNALLGRVAAYFDFAMADKEGKATPSMTFYDCHD